MVGYWEQNMRVTLWSVHVESGKSHSFMCLAYHGSLKTA